MLSQLGNVLVLFAGETVLVEIIGRRFPHILPADSWMSKMAKKIEQRNIRDMCRGVPRTTDTIGTTWYNHVQPARPADGLEF